jgi:hypothetical protein
MSLEQEDEIRGLIYTKKHQIYRKSCQGKLKTKFIVDAEVNQYLKHIVFGG